MNKLYNLIYSLLAVLASGAGPLFAESHWYVEAGASHVSFNKDYGSYFAMAPTDPPYTLSKEKRRQTAPFIALGSQLTDWLALRLSYHFMNDITANDAVALLIGGVPPRFVPIQVVDKIKWATLEPELKWKIASPLALTFSPSANWILNREIAFLPDRRMLYNRREQSVTFGATAGAVWTFTEHTALALSYGYTDFKPSRGREARILSGSLRVFF